MRACAHPLNRCCHTPAAKAQPAFSKTSPGPGHCRLPSRNALFCLRRCPETDPGVSAGASSAHAPRPLKSSGLPAPESRRPGCVYRRRLAGPRNKVLQFPKRRAESKIRAPGRQVCSAASPSLTMTSPANSRAFPIASDIAHLFRLRSSPRLCSFMRHSTASRPCVLSFPAGLPPCHSRLRGRRRASRRFRPAGFSAAPGPAGSVGKCN